jgi:hypothetical protein
VQLLLLLVVVAHAKPSKARNFCKTLFKTTAAQMIGQQPMKQLPALDKAANPTLLLLLTLLLLRLEAVTQPR